MVQSDLRRSVTRSLILERHLLFAMTLLVVACWTLICALSRQPGERALLVFLLASAVMVLAAGLVVWRYHEGGKRIPMLWVFISALLLRLISLYGVPLFEDDYHRYLWDGYQMAATGDPYTLAPAVFFDRDVPEIFEPVLSLINYPEIASVYGPVTQWIFAVGYWLDAAEVWPLQLLAGVADFAVLFVLYRLGAGNALLFYAWSPLLLKEFSLTAHPDIYAILAVMVSVYLLRKPGSAEKSLQWRTWLAGIALGLGFGAKVFAILVLPYLLTTRWGLRFWVSLLASFVITLLAITVWFRSLVIWVPEGLLAMADSWMFNAGLYLLALNFLEFQTIKIVLLGVFMLYGLITVVRRLLQLRTRAVSATAVDSVTQKIQGSQVWAESVAAFRGDWLYLVFLLALPVINPWYVAWLLPFATLYPRWWSWTLGYCCLISYWYGANAGISGAGSLLLPTPVVMVEYFSVIAVALIAAVITRRHSQLRKYAGA